MGLSLRVWRNMCFLRELSLSIIAFFLSSISSAATFTVDLNGSGDFTAIQPAIDAVRAGDTVLVKAGEYRITQPITFQGKAVILKSEGGPAATMIRMADVLS